MVHHSLSTPKCLYILNKPSIGGGKFSLIQINREAFDLEEDGDVRAVLKKKYQQHRGYWSRILYGDPIGIAYFTVSLEAYYTQQLITN